MYINPADPPRQPARTDPDLSRMRIAGERIASLTAYDAGFVRAMEVAGIDAVLVGDSLGIVVQDGANTASVSVADMLYHSRCVAKGLQQAPVDHRFSRATRLIHNLELEIP